jgi:hypothetical protein
VRQQLTSTAPAITSVAPSVPPRLAAAVERCLHKEPIRRYRNAESFAEAIDLAFEHAKEIPAPLRVWLSQGQKELPARLAFIGIGAMTGPSSPRSHERPTLSLPFFGLVPSTPFAPLVGLSFVPELSSSPSRPRRGVPRRRPALGDARTPTGCSRRKSNTSGVRARPRSGA